jgi:hypothetical protein
MVPSVYPVTSCGPLNHHIIAVIFLITLGGLSACNGMMVEYVSQFLSALLSPEVLASVCTSETSVRSISKPAESTYIFVAVLYKVALHLFCVWQRGLRLICCF